MIEAPFYVEIKTKDDKELIPCADKETAEYCAKVMLSYGFKKTEVTIISFKENTV